ncbi:MAG TPA: hypothetical protein VGM13_17360 [Thermoanaerobaculia bacterium]|jgi:hypothetical protein
MKNLVEEIHGISPDIRYVAVYRDGTLVSSVKPGLEGASSSESDKYEELIVNPALLTLVTQRGNIDCGGARFLLVRYGSFFEYVAPVSGGHVSVGIDAKAEPLKLAAAIQMMIASWSESALLRVDGHDFPSPPK